MNIYLNYKNTIKHACHINVFVSLKCSILFVRIAHKLLRAVSVCSYFKWFMYLLLYPPANVLFTAMPIL